VAQVQDIMDLYEREGLSLRQIAKKLHVSRNTVRRVIDRPGYYLGVEPKNERNKKRTILVPAMIEKIDQILKDDLREHRKQRHTAHRIWERLLEDGFNCGESTIRRYVGGKKRGMREVFIPLEFGAGEDAQVDWGYGTVEIDGARIEAAYFSGVLCWSRAPYLRIYHAATQEAWVVMQYKMEPMKEDEVSRYISHHMKLAGALTPVFSEQALEAIASHSAGWPRLVNNLALTTLLVGAQMKQNPIDAEAVRIAAAEVCL